ncbi:MAG TPA: hypothetical protein PLZ44_01505 [Methanothrix sp.]|nr:hypothetical protein [Methanothrix sp.]
MRPIYSIVILFLLTAASYAQLEPDKERFDVVLHPGDLEERTLKVANIGDDAIYKISKTEISGTARGYIFLSIPDDLEDKPLMPEDKAEIKVYFALPPEAKPGTYTGFLYLLDSEPPSLPIRIDFNLNVIAQESYGIGMTIDDAKSAELSANAEDIAQFDLSVKNLGAFRDVASIDIGQLPDGWSVTLLDGKKTPDFPYNLSIDPGTTHTMQLQIETTKPGQKNNLTITATSLGNKSMNSSVEAAVDFAVAVRGYNVDIQVPDKMVVNKTYKGSFKIMLDVKETVMVGIITPPELMVIPLAQTVEVDPSNPGIANFTMLASESGEYPIIFRLMDSHGIPMPEEVSSVDVVAPEGMAVLTGDDFIHSTIASSSVMGNGTVEFDVVTTNPAKINEADLEKLQDYSEILILGNQSIVSGDAERQLKGSQIKRLGGDSLYEECWLYAANIWRNGTADAILCNEEPADIFRAYSLSKVSGAPMIVCQGNVTEGANSAIRDMTEKNVSLTRALYIGDIDAKYKKPLQDAGIETEEVKA